MIGLYTIVNLHNRKAYVGSSCNVGNRFTQHKTMLNGKYHPNRHLMSAWEKYGADSFVLETLFNEQSKEAAIESEILLILDLSPAYNSTMGGDGTSGHKVTPEGRLKMGRIHIGNKYNLGRNWSDAQKNEMSKKKKGCLAPPPTEKMQETRAKNMRKSAFSNRKSVICINDGIEYNSISHAADAYRIHKSSISKVCRKERNSIFGLVFKFKDLQNEH
jgi:group I intron endonuclease